MVPVKTCAFTLSNLSSVDLFDIQVSDIADKLDQRVLIFIYYLKCPIRLPSEHKQWCDYRRFALCPASPPVLQVFSSDNH